jgi:O-antigen/teichoic acid export membrane protein
MASGFELGEKALTAVLLPIAIVFVLLAHPVVDLIYGSDYENAVASLQLLGAMTVFFGINEFAAVALIARDRPFMFTRVLLVATVVNVVTNVLLIPPLGATGAALAALASGILLAVLALVVLRIELGPIRLLRSFAGPVVAGGCMAALIVATGRHLIIGVIAGGLVYVAALVLFERSVFRADFEVFARLARRRGVPDALPEGA